MTVTMNKESWERGVRDGFANRKSEFTRETSISYCSGWIEGDAARQGYEVNVDVAKICGLVKEER